MENPYLPPPLGPAGKLELLSYRLQLAAQREEPAAFKSSTATWKSRRLQYLYLLHAARMPPHVRCIMPNRYSWRGRITYARGRTYIRITLAFSEFELKSSTWTIISGVKGVVLNKHQLFLFVLVFLVGKTAGTQRRR